MAQRRKLFRDREFVKEFILKASVIACPEQKKNFEEISLSNDTIRPTRQEENLDRNFDSN